MAKWVIKKGCWTRSAKIYAIWSVCAVIFYCFFQIALRNSSSHKDSSSRADSGSSMAYAEQRSILYSKMAKDLDEKGAAFLKQGETSQSLSLSDLFTLKDGIVTPVLRPADPPVRANVLYLSTEYSVPISEAVKNVFSPYFDKSIWFQNSSMYHFSMFHASHHKTPVPVTETEIEAEANAVEGVAATICPLNIVLDRVILTSTGVLLGCWQVASGNDPVTIRAKLKAALPRAPQNQLYDEAMLHTSFARLLGHPKKFPKDENKSELQIFHDLVSKLNSQIQGTKATVSELWYVEELDLLALALDGRMKTRKFQLACSLA
ncbi:uncharacterized protein LOC127241882 [Andrographis paniculata]|uniref:uncharacterized protein LOC127241882 n=1 Tax=Andrographis paniculata TaxID=175694 RepID=UPI0021E7D823|nr:uncharacterized protein LOC127241882 [Andrographis paniculata]